MKDFLRPPVARPLAVSIIGLGVCALSALPVALGAWALVDYLSSAVGKPPARSLPESLFLWVLLGRPTLGCLMMGAGIALLDLRAWARDLMAALLWLQAAGAGFGLLALLQPSAHLSAEYVATEVATGLVAAAGIIALRQRSVREAFAASEAARRQAKAMNTAS